jgi:hypothetical protein
MTHTHSNAGEFTTSAGKPPLKAAGKAAISAKRMSEGLMKAVIRGLDPRIHLLRKSPSKWMDCRVKPGNDD